MPDPADNGCFSSGVNFHLLVYNPRLLLPLPRIALSQLLNPKPIVINTSTHYIPALPLPNVTGAINLTTIFFPHE